MSFYSDASLVLIPSGYKDQKIYSAKPTDGLGDLVFSRASDATRVASNGLIEKVRTNTILHSQAFDNAAYNKGVGGSVVANTVVAPDGTMTADAYTWATATATYAYLTQSVAGTSQIPNTFSIYLKRPAGSGSRTVRLAVTDLTISTTFGPNLTVTESWQRFELSRTSASTTGNVGVGLMTGSTGVSIAAGDILEVWGAQLETGDIATDYIPTTTAAVSVGPVSGLPRLDYLNSSCPRLLLEGQRSNLALFSEQFDNAAWVEVGATIGANTIISPDGTVSADSLIENTSAGLHIAYQGFVSSSGSTYTVSFYVSPVGRTNCYLRADTSAGTIRQRFTLTGDGITYSPNTTITKVQNGFYRCSYTFTETTGASRLIAIEAADGSNINYTGNGQTALYLWGAQLEVGAYATSYIPTLSTSVTRVAEGCLKTGVSSLIGQTEGTLFFDFIPDSKDNVDDFRFQVGTIATDNWIFVGNVNGKIRGYVRSTSVVFDDESTTVVVGTRYKVAISYSTTAVSFYINGTLIQEVSGSYTIPTCDRVAIQANLSTDNLLSSRVNQALLFKTRLSNSDLAAITTL
jgi:hypothetical protein